MSESSALTKLKCPTLKIFLRRKLIKAIHRLLLIANLLWNTAPQLEIFQHNPLLLPFFFTHRPGNKVITVDQRYSCDTYSSQVYCPSLILFPPSSLSPWSFIIRKVAIGQESVIHYETEG